MGLNFRRRSGRIYDGSKLIVPGQQKIGVKVFPNSFEYKKGSKNENLGPGIPTEIEKEIPLCVNGCAVFTQANNEVFYYNFSSNTVVEVVFIYIVGMNLITDIANTTNKLWILTSVNAGDLREYNMTLCPFSLTLNRTFTNSGFPNQFPTNGLAAIDQNNLLSTGGGLNGQVSVVKYNITTNNLIPTILFYLPYNRQLSGDLIYVPNTPTGPKIITLTFEAPWTQNLNFISQFNATTGAIEMDKNIPSNLINSPYGLFTKDNKIYIQNENDSTVWNVGLNSPYPFIYTNQINYSGLFNFGGGSSNDSRCNTVSFKKQKPYISIPGTSAIDPIISCTEWKDPKNRTEIYLNPSGITVVGTTKLYNDPDFTDPIPFGYWVSDGQQVYLIGEDGLIKNTTYCT